MLHESFEPDGVDGYQTCTELRCVGLSLPIVFLTARTIEADKLIGFRTGADDYVTKPFSLLVLRARIEAVLRRYNQRSTVLCYGGDQIDLIRHRTHHPGGDMHLPQPTLRTLRRVGCQFVATPSGSVGCL